MAEKETLVSTDCKSDANDVQDIVQEVTEKNVSDEPGGAVLSAAQRARMERQRLRARELHHARLVRRAHLAAEKENALDSGGGFLLEEEAGEAPRAAAPPAPVAAPRDRPRCLHCAARFPHSYLFDTFDHNVCDACRDEEGEHSLMTRTEAKGEFLLKDCDLDLRPPPLRCVRRRNPHRGGGDMRLYLRAQLRERAHLVWGGPAALDEERARRQAARAASARKQAARRLRALRMDVRSSLYDASTAHHDHRFGPETHDPAEDLYSRVCATCGHTETYEKM